jgi:hypothetical protein
MAPKHEPPDWKSCRLNSAVDASNIPTRVEAREILLQRGFAVESRGVLSRSRGGDAVMLSLPRQPTEIFRPPAPGAVPFAPIGVATATQPAFPFVDWMQLVADSLVIFDGSTLHLIVGRSARKQLDVFAVVRPDYMATTSRVRLVRGGIILDVMHTPRMHGETAREFELWYFSDRAPKRVFRRSLPSLPIRGKNGGSFSGPNEAHPLWDAAGNCLLFSDGSSQWLVRGSTTGFTVDSIRLPIHERAQDATPAGPHETGGTIADSALAGLIPEPSLWRNIGALALEDEGRVWLGLTRRSPASASAFALRVDMTSRQIDSVPIHVFPRAFLGPNRWLGLLWTQIGEPYLATDSGLTLSHLDEGL